MGLAGMIPVIVTGGVVKKFSDSMLGRPRYKNPHRGAKRQRRLRRASPLGRSARPF